MDLLKPLRKLDDLIYGVHEKVYHKAYKSLGWSKYDLATKAEQVAGINAVGMATYDAIRYSINGGQLNLIFSLTWGLNAYEALHNSKKINKAAEEKEMSYMVRTGSPQIPDSGIYRGVKLSFATLSAVLGVYLWQNVSDDPFVKLYFLDAFTATGVFLFSASADYFKRQTMQPPKKKKKFFKTALEKIVSPFRPKPQLQPEKATERQTLEHLLVSRI